MNVLWTYSMWYARPKENHSVTAELIMICMSLSVHGNVLTELVMWLCWYFTFGTQITAIKLGCDFIRLITLVNVRITIFRWNLCLSNNTRELHVGTAKCLELWGYACCMILLSNVVGILISLKTLLTHSQNNAFGNFFRHKPVTLV
jgi:hypothetical protein